MARSQLLKLLLATAALLGLLALWTATPARGGHGPPDSSVVVQTTEEASVDGLTAGQPRR